MLLEKEKNLILKYSIKMADAGLTVGTMGNISIFNREEQLYAITPSGLDYYDMQPEDIVVMDMEGNVVEGDRKPSSEHFMHRTFYKRRTDISAVIHTHSPYATAVVCLRVDVPYFHCAVRILGGHEIPVAPFAEPGTQALADTTEEWMKGHFAVLMQGHGMLAGAATIEKCFSYCEEVESLCQVYAIAKSCGGPVNLK